MSSSPNERPCCTSMKTSGSVPVLEMRCAAPTGTSIASPAATGRSSPSMRHDALPAHDEPVLGAVRVTLVAQPLAGLDREPLHLVRRLVGEHLVPTPRALLCLHPGQSTRRPRGRRDHPAARNIAGSPPSSSRSDASAASSTATRDRIDVPFDRAAHELEQRRRRDRVDLDALALVQPTSVVRASLRGPRRQLVLVDLLPPHRHALEGDLRARGELAEPALEVAVDLDARTGRSRRSSRCTSGFPMRSIVSAALWTYERLANPASP